jgi:S-(hydroxymethyl)glutathione dehydrogenase / alcohol dehydrogenase
MKALVVNAVGGKFNFEDVDIAAPLGREVLVDVRASGLCHTDLLFAANPIFPTPAVFGHEICGIVAEIGPEVTQFHAGDHVVGSLASRAVRARDASRAAPSSVNTRKRP